MIYVVNKILRKSPLFYILLRNMNKLIFVIFLSIVSHTLMIKFALKRKPFIEEDNDGFSPMTLTLCLGTPPQCFNLAYDTGSYFIWVPDESLGSFYSHYFDPDNSATFLEELIEVNSNETDGKIIGYEAVDTLSLDESNPHNRYFFNFVVAQSFYYSSIHADGNLGLARNYSHPINSVDDDSTIERFSFLEMLYNLNIINQNVFYHRYNDDKTGELIIGEEMELKSNEYMFKCKCVYIKDLPQRFNDFWNCKLDKMTLEGIENELINNYAIFSSAEQFIIAPYRTGIRIMERYKNYAPDNCIISSQEDYQLECKEFDFSSLPPLSFQFGEYIMEFPAEQLYIKVKNEYVFAIKASNNYKFWIFGDQALKQQAMMFDMDNNIIGFITTNQVPKSVYLSFLLGIIGVIFVGVIIFFGLSGYMRKREKKELEEKIIKAEIAIPFSNIVK